jgi:hypothetical protein
VKLQLQGKEQGWGRKNCIKWGTFRAKQVYDDDDDRMDDDDDDSKKSKFLDPQLRNLYTYCWLCAMQDVCICHVLKEKSQAFFPSTI